jgi:hypothetical protein
MLALAIVERMSTVKKQDPPHGDAAATKPPANISAEGRKWLEENAEAIKSINEWVEKNGLPLEKYRMF